MRLCYLNYSESWGGLEMYSGELFQQVLELGYDAHFFLEAGSPLARTLEAAGLGDRLVPRRSRKYVDLPGFRALQHHVRERGVDLVHTFRSADVFHSVLGTRGLGDRRPALVHHLQMLPHRPRRDFFHRRVYRHLDRVLTITEQIRERVRELWPVPAERVEALYYGLDLSPFDPSPESRARARSRLGLAPDATVVGLVGQICEIKGQRFVVEALAPRIDAGELELVLVGTPGNAVGEAYHRALLADVAALGRPEGVHVLGFRDDVPELLPGFDVFVLGSVVEAFGRVVIEAMAAGCLTLASRAGGVPEIVDDGVDGWLYRPGDAADLRAALERALALDDRARDEVRRRARAKVSDKFALARHHEELGRIYRELTGAARPTPAG